MALAPIVRDMQALARETEALQTHGCVDDARRYLVKAERVTIDAFLGFMQQAPADQVTSLTTAAEREARNYRMTFDTCVQ